MPSSRHADDSRDGDGQDRRNSFANPPVLGDKNPDYLVNGKIFDCYAPTTSNIRNIADRVETKVVRRQPDRIVLNMTDSYRKANTPTPTSPCPKRR